MTIRSRAASWYVDHPVADWTVVPLGLLVLLVVPSDVATVSNFAMGVATVGGVLLGMGAVVFTLYLGGSGPRFTALRAFEGKQIRATWFGVLASFVLASFVALLALALAPMMMISMSISGCAAFLLSVKAWRMVLMLRYITEISDREALEAAGGPPRKVAARS